MFAEAMHNVRTRQLKASRAKAEIDKKLDADNAEDLSLIERLGGLLRRYSLADRDMVFGEKASSELTGAKLTIYTDHDGSFAITDEDALVEQLLANDELKALVTPTEQVVYVYDKAALKELLKSRPDLRAAVPAAVLSFKHKFKVEVPLSPAEKRAKVKPSPWTADLDEDQAKR